MNDRLQPIDASSASVIRGSKLAESCNAQGRFAATCIGPDGQVKWEDSFANVVVTEGKNLALDTFFNGSGYSTTGPYIGLVSSVGYSAVNVANTAAQINGSNGWKEAGSDVNFPLYTAPRKTCGFNPASSGSKSFATTASFAITPTGGTVKGCFIVLGAGASATIASTTGTLWSVGLFSGGDKVVGDGDTLNVSYSTSL
jgi:hypothetical protein